jgi:glucose-1-phosphate cytidylyltransferase
MTKVVIFCGGYGTRIRGVADDMPKPMIRIGNRPILWHVMSIYAQADHKDFVLCLGYKGWSIKEYFLNYRYFVSDFTLTLDKDVDIEMHDAHPEKDWRITMAETGLDTQTAGRLYRVREYLKDEDIFCVTYGDGVADIDINALIDFHKSHGKVGTVTGVRPAGRFGVLDVSDVDGVPTVKQFTEKPQTMEGMINGGFFVFDQRLWDYIDDDDTMPFEKQPLMRLAADGQLAVYEHSGFWQPMDTYREWKLLNGIWDSGDVPWRK